MRVILARTLRRASVACLFVILTVAMSGSSRGQDLPKLHYAGFAFAGEAGRIGKTFPNSVAINEAADASGISPLDRQLNLLVNSAKFDHFVLTGDLGNTKTGDALALAFVLTWENLAQEPVGRDVKVTADLRAEALVFDFQAMKVIAAYPFGLQSRQVLPAAPSPGAIREIFRSMYFGSQGSIFDAFIRTLKSTDIKRSYGAYAQVTAVDIEDKAAKTFAGFQVDPDQLKGFIAEAFDASLSKNVGIPVLPYLKGQAIGGKMSARFANGNVYNLALPAPDYQIRLALRGFKKVEIDSNSAETGFAYASYFKIGIDQPLAGKPYLDTDFKYAVTKVVPKAVEHPDDWGAYQESMLSLLDGLSKQLSAPDDDWIEKWGGGAATRPQLAAAAKALARCR
ncbi:MAG: hypothetical protein WDN69_30020 [Aliidongia sp.]